MKTNKKGISLIVLVITIIVMMILAATVVITLAQNGIIGKANEAKEGMTKAQINEAAQLAWSDVYLYAMSEGKDLETFNWTEEVNKHLIDNGVNTEGFVIEADKSGITKVELTVDGEQNGGNDENLPTKWTKVGYTLVKGTQTIKIGDIIEYDETKESAIKGLDATTWKILGADEEGNLLIVSDNIEEFSLKYNSTASNHAQIRNDWMNSKTLMNGLCAPYGQGESAIGVRAITVEDINNVTGLNGEGFDTDKLGEYNMEVVYSYNASTTPKYTSDNASGTVTTAHTNGFYYYDGTAIQHVTNLSSKSSGEITTQRNTCYTYSYSSTEESKKAYDMLKGNFMLASTYCKAAELGLAYGMHVMWGNYNYLMAEGVWNSHGNSDAVAGTGISYPIRAVVTLDKDIVLDGDSDTGWTY